MQSRSRPPPSRTRERYGSANVSPAPQRRSFPHKTSAPPSPVGKVANDVDERDVPNFELEVTTRLPNGQSTQIDTVNFEDEFGGSI